MKINVLLLPFSLLTTICFGQWQLQNVNTDASFRAVSTAGPNVVWIGGSKGTFVHTSDGGKSWQTGVVPDAQTCDFRDVHAIDAQTAYLMSAGLAQDGYARIYKTTDGAKSWQLIYQTKQTGVFFDSMDFWDNDHGIVVSDPVDNKWVILTTTDGGKSWQPVPSASLPALESGEAAFAASGTSLVVRGKKNVWIASGGGKSGRVFRSADGGKSWSVSATPLPGGEATGLFGMHFFTDKNGMVVGGNYKQETKPDPNAALTRDGGKTWELVSPTDPPGLKEGVTILPGERIITVGPSGTSLSADQGQTWQRLDTDRFHAISCVKGTCYAVGEKGRVAMRVFK